MYDIPEEETIQNYLLLVRLGVSVCFDSGVCECVLIQVCVCFDSGVCECVF